MARRGSILSNIDKTTVFIFFILVIMGWLNIFSSTCGPEMTQIHFDIHTNYGRQLIFIAVSIFIAGIILLMDGDLFQRISYLVYGLICFALVLVLLIGDEVSGAKSWIKMGPFSFQPAEFAKFATAMAFSRFLGDHEFSRSPVKYKVIAFALFLIPIGLIMLEPDAGSALVFLSFFIPLFREGLSVWVVLLGLYIIVLSVLTLVVNKYILLGVVFAIVLVVYFFLRHRRGIILYLVLFLVVSAGCAMSVDYVYNNFLEEHHRTRIEVLLGQKDDIKGAGYNVHQSKIAIGSGGFTGKGYLKGTQTKYDFVPEQQTDFIFCTVGEEFGFLGSLVVLGLFLTLLIRLIFMAERQRTTFSRIYGYCVVGIFFFHVAINICMTIGLMPVIGIPLPFFSYGGSSLIGFTILLFIFVKLDAYRYNILH